MRVRLTSRRAGGKLCAVAPHWLLRDQNPKALKIIPNGPGRLSSPPPQPRQRDYARFRESETGTGTTRRGGRREGARSAEVRHAHRRVPQYRLAATVQRGRLAARSGGRPGLL